MTRFIIWLILAAVVLRILWTFVRSVLDGAGMLRGPRQPPSVKLVRDPVCGMFVVPSQALTTGSGADTHYFCSEKCRREWRRA